MDKAAITNFGKNSYLSFLQFPVKKATVSFCKIKDIVKPFPSAKRLIEACLST